jgi:hypothetical protein
MALRKTSVIFFILTAWTLSGPGSWAAKPDTPALLNGFVYFAGVAERCLCARARQFPGDLDPHELGISILTTLLAGPADPELVPIFPETIQVRALFIREDGRAWVDLDIPDGSIPGMDTGRELLAVYAIVNSLTVNIPGIKQVKILVNGSDTASLGGHVSLEYFYKTNMLIVK